MIREHEVRDDRCIHCGAPKPGPGSTCIVRDGAAPARETGRRVPACDDADAISERLAELRKERDEALNITSTMTAPDWTECRDIRGLDVDAVHEAVREMSEAMRERGATWGQITLLPDAENPVELVCEGWRVRPDDIEPA